MEKVLRQYILKKHRLTPDNLRRSLAGAAARAEDENVTVMVSTPPPRVQVPQKLECLSRLRNEGCLFDLCEAEIDANGRLTGYVVSWPWQTDKDGRLQMVNVSVNPAAISGCTVSYIEKMS